MPFFVYNKGGKFGVGYGTSSAGELAAMAAGGITGVAVLRVMVGGKRRGTGWWAKVAAAVAGAGAGGLIYHALAAE